MCDSVLNFDFISYWSVSVESVSEAQYAESGSPTLFLLAVLSV